MRSHIDRTDTWSPPVVDVSCPFCPKQEVIQMDIRKYKCGGCERTFVEGEI